MTNLPLYLNQMWLGQVPLLTKGPFALLYGGQEIVPQLSKVGTAVTAVAEVTYVTGGAAVTGITALTAVTAVATVTAVTCGRSYHSYHSCLRLDQ